jgi:hypothetical protein
VIDALYPSEDDKLNAPDVFMAIDQKDVKPLEVSALIEALVEMGINNLSEDINVDDITDQSIKKCTLYRFRT